MQWITGLASIVLYNSVDAAVSPRNPRDDDSARLRNVQQHFNCLEVGNASNPDCR
jgi:hypothetical protein